MKMTCTKRKPVCFDRAIDTHWLEMDFCYIYTLIDLILHLFVALIFFYRLFYLPAFVK